MLILTEGLNILRLNVPRKLAGKKIAETDIREKTGYSIIAIQKENSLIVNPGPDEEIPVNGKIYIVGNLEEKNFYKLYK